MVLLQKLVAEENVYWHNGLYFFAEQEQPEIFTLEDSWKVGGHYVFVSPDMIPTPYFLQQANEYFKNISSEDLFIWVENPEKPYTEWKVRDLSTTAVRETGTIRPLKSDSSLIFYPYFIRFGHSTIDCDGNFFTITGTNNCFISPELVCPIEEIIIIKVIGQDCGRLFFSAKTTLDVNTNLFKKLNTGIQFAMNLQKKQLKLNNPILVCNEIIELVAEIHPCNPWDPSMTRLFLPKRPFISTLTTIGGRKLILIPDKNACLVFEKMLVDNSSNDNQITTQLYLGLCGRFHISDPYFNELYDLKILCGFSGAEYAKLPQNNPYLLFVPHKPGFIKRDKPDDTKGEFSEETTTSWIRFPDGFQYSDQSESAPLYAANSSTPPFLDYMEIAAASYPGRSKEVPIGVYKEDLYHTYHTLTLEEMNLFEQVLWSCRHDLLTDILPTPKKPDYGTSKIGTTPQGLLANVYYNYGKWDWLTLGKTTNGHGVVKELLLPHVSKKVSKQLQQKQVCLIYEDAKEFKTNFFKGPNGAEEFTVYIDKWGFALHPEKWRMDFEETNTAVILKFTDTQNIKSLMKGSKILEAALSKAGDKNGKTNLSDYKDFVHTVYDPSFQGVIFLNCPLLYEDLPEFLQVIVGDIDPKLLYAHHVAISGNRLELVNGALDIKHTAISALVDFKGKNQIIPDGKPLVCDFTTLKLKLVVKDSRMIAFNSMSELLVNSFFGSSCLQQKSTSGNCLVLDGTCYDNGKGITYCFSLRNPVEYQIESNPVESVFVDSVGLSISNNGNQTFTLGGRLYFAPDETCDLFSYGRTKEDALRESGIKFDGMHYQIPKNNTAYAEYEAITLNIDSAKPRNQSFCDQFPCILDSFKASNSQSPDDLGYRAITSPVLQGKLGDKWFALDWKINLGTLGGLSNSEPLYMHLLTAWSSNTNGESSYYIGAQMPKALGSDGIDMQGILKLGFQSIELRVDNKNEMKDFQLRLHNFNLRVLGIPVIPGNNDVIIFVHHDEISSTKKLGWFAAYENK